MDLNKIKQLNERTKRMRETNILNISRDLFTKDNEEEKKEALPEEKQPTTAFLEKRFQVLLEMSIKQFQNELNQVNEQLSLLQDQIGIIQQTITKLQNNPQSLNHQQAPQQAPAPAQPVPKKEPLPEPPQNKVSSEDVSIEKFFYFGKGGRGN